MIGCHIVEIETRADLDKALEEPVAMVVLLGKQEHLAAVRLEEIAAVCKPRGIPIMVDAASEHIERPSPWLARGADLVIYSGGKFLRGPQTSGPPARQQETRRGGVAQRLAAPGAGPADEGVEGGHHRRPRRARTLVRRARPRRRAAEMARRLRHDRRPGRADPRRHRRDRSSLRGSTACRGCKITWDREKYPLDGLGLRQRVLDGEPRVMLDDNSATENSIAVDPFQLQPGEAAQVGDAVVAALLGASRPERVDRAAPASARDRRQVGIERRFPPRRAQPPPQPRTARRRPRRPPAIGRSSTGRSAARSRRRGAFLVLQRYEASTISYRFEGAIHDGR